MIPVMIWGTLINQKSYKVRRVSEQDERDVGCAVLNRARGCDRAQRGWCDDAKKGKKQDEDGGKEELCGG